MRLNLLSLAGLTALMGMGMVSSAGAQSMPAGSLLVYPEFDNRYGVVNALTVTNTNQDVQLVSPSLQAGTVDVEFIYIDHETCEEFNRIERLTPNDTLTVLTKVHNPQQDQGYVYAFVRDVQTQEVIAFDWLIGSNLIIDGLSTFQYSTNPFTFLAGEGLNDGDATDLDGDTQRDLNGAEYQEAPDTILVPRFFGQNVERARLGELVLINLTGGAHFDATLNFLIYNDNEEAFSANHTFNCWDKPAVLDVSYAFDNHFLLTATNHAQNEMLGAPAVKAGWFRIDGNVASSYAKSIKDPAFLAVYIEKVGRFAAADLPYTTGTQDNGDLLSWGPMGDMNE